MTTFWLSGENSAAMIFSPVWNTESGAPDAASQRWAVRSPDAVRIMRPSRLNWATDTTSSCPASDNSMAPVLASQTRAVSSLDAVTIRVPSGLCRTVWILVLCPVRVRVEAVAKAGGGPRRVEIQPFAVNVSSGMPLSHTIRLPSLAPEAPSSAFLVSASESTGAACVLSVILESLPRLAKATLFDFADSRLSVRGSSATNGPRTSDPE